MPLRLVLVAALALSSSRAVAQDTLERIRQLYVDADYDGALTTLDRLPPAAAAGEQIERDRYRAMALIALGRTGEAHAAIERILMAEPRYELSDEQAAPRIRMAFSDVRRRVLPQMARSFYGEGKAAFDRKDVSQALPAFERALIVIDLLPAGEPGMADLRTLVDGFLQLSRASAAGAEPMPTGSAGSRSAPPAVATSGSTPPAATPSAAAPAPESAASTPPAGAPDAAPASPAPASSSPRPPAPTASSPAASSPEASSPEVSSPEASSPAATTEEAPATPSPAGTAPPPTAGPAAAPSTVAAPPAAVTMTEPVALRQTFPPWKPLRNQQQQFSGIIEVDIDERGDVVAARMINAVHPMYDPLLMAAAREWKYDPARRGDVAVRSSKRISVVLHPY